MNRILILLPAMLVACTLLISAGTVKDNSRLNIEEPTNYLSFPDIRNWPSDKPISPEELTNALLFLQNKEITLVGYPYAYPADGELSFENNSYMIDTEDNSTANIEVQISFKNETDNAKVLKGQLMAVKGTVSIGYAESMFGDKMTLYISNAEFVAAKAETPDVLNDVQKIDISKPLQLKDLFTTIDAYYKSVMKKEFTVKGYYNNTTSSNVSSGTYHDVVLGEEFPVHCGMKDAPDSDQLLKFREAGQDVSIKGKLGPIDITPSLREGVVLTN